MIVNVCIEFASKELLRIIFKKLETNLREIPWRVCIAGRMQNTAE